LPRAFLAALALSFLAAPVRADDAPAPSLEETARRENVERLGKELKRLAESPRAAQKKDEIRKAIEALSVLKGVDAAKASMNALALDDEDVEKDVARLIESEHAKPLVAPIAALLDHKDYRRRFRLHALLAHALSVIANVEGIEPLTELVRSEDAKVVAAAADALVVFRTAPHARRVEPVKRLLEVFESTWNLKESLRPDDKVASDRAKADWEVYGAACRRALQALTGQAQLVRPRQFREWWNDHKKATNW
jgi:hypothetical protein